MLGRAEEAARVEGLVRDARGGVSGSLLISGEPGIGKTVLLAHARAVAETEGALVVETSGAESEASLAFAGLSDLLAPVLGRLDDLPAPQADALRGALALGPPQPGDRFTTYAATLSLLASAAEDRPVVCIVDDAHWLDAESFEAVQFASRRLGAEGVAILLGARDGLSPRVDDSPLARLRLRGLASADAGALIADLAPVAPTEDVRDTLVAGAQGNPLALIELAGALTVGQLGGAEPLPEPLPVGPYLQNALLRPVRALPDSARRALVVLSADDGTTGFLPAALAAEGLAMGDLEPAERAGVIAIGPTRALFSHPLVRAAVYQAADAAGRRSAHRAHAASAAAVGESALDRRAWHLALAATGPDEAVAAELETAGARAAARNGHAAACEAFEAAARLSPGAAERGRRLLVAGQSGLAGGEFIRAGRLFDEVITLAADGSQMLGATVGRGHVETMAGSTSRAIEILVGASERTAASSPEVAAMLLLQASIPAMWRTDLTTAEEVTTRAVVLAPPSDPALQLLAAAASASVAIFACEPREVPPDLLGQLAQLAAGGDPVSFAWMIGSLQGLVLAEDYSRAASAYDQVIASARALSTPSALPWPLSSRADLRRRLGQFDHAMVDAAESLRLAEDTHQSANAGFARWSLAWVHAVRGEQDECGAQTGAMLASAERSDAASIRVFAHDVLGLSALGLGDVEAAERHLRFAANEHERIGHQAHPLIDSYRQDLVESLVRGGKDDRARDELVILETQAEKTRSPSATAAVERCRGLLADHDDYERHFGAALALHARTPTPFERARTELCLGERRRRARRMREARQPLESALVTFESIGAAPWADRARRELRAAGAQPRTVRRRAADPLTPQELQVALAVSEGATNKEVAAALLISPKTVEYHLGKVYEKLGVRSRVELAGRMAREGVSPSGT